MSLRAPSSSWPQLGDTGTFLTVGEGRCTDNGQGQAWGAVPWEGDTAQGVLGPVKSHPHPCAWSQPQLQAAPCARYIHHLQLAVPGTQSPAMHLLPQHIRARFVPSLHIAACIYGHCLLSRSQARSSPGCERAQGQAVLL